MILPSLPGNISVSIIPGKGRISHGICKGDMPLSTFCHRGNAGEETLSRFHTGRRGFDRRRIYLLPKGGLQEICIRFDAESEEAESMRSSGLCAPEDVQDQIDTTNKCYREYREKLREFLGIDREHDVSITWESPDYRHTSWNEQLLAEQKREETVGQSRKKENAGQERQIHFRR